ncbi:bifunctional phosphoglucose/phosphomannose isomerase [Candidatus Thorarchaeota archaeon]|nr:MAG: bifunctional phosphoglucose/phosphomannose isomerase [Candidatus Thorarchaeota archaeon]
MTLPASIKADDMRNLVNHFPQLLTSFQINQITLDIIEDYSKREIKGICFLGMGGSSIAGNYVRALLSEDAQIPISVVRDYSIPAYVDKNWAVIAVSYSGNTQETITSLRSVKEIGARIILLTSGGMMAQEEKYPLILIPKGLQPRATLPLMLSVALPITETLAGLKLSDFHMLEKVLAKRALTWNDWAQPPRKLAESFIEKIPLFIGAQHLTPVAYRAKCQINENSKALAFQSELPESNHNEIESFTSTNGCSIIPVFLRSGFESDELEKRFRVTFDIYKEMGLNPVNLEVKENTRLEEMLILTHFLDMVSVELADIRNVDPVSVERIKELKHRLRR